MGSLLAFESVTSFFGIKVCVFCVFLENDKTDLRQIFFQGLRENTCSLQPALKSNAPELSAGNSAKHLVPYLYCIITIKRGRFAQRLTFMKTTRIKIWSM